MSSNVELTTEQAIMEAAEELFLENGYAGTSTIAIARKAGCNQALVHYYYRSKENLFGLVFRKKIAVFLSFFLQVSNEDLPFEEKLTKRIAAHFDMIHANERLPVMFFNEVATNGNLAKKVLENFSDLPLPVIMQLQSELDAEFAAGRICKTQATDLVFNIFSMNLIAFLTKPLVQMFTLSSDDIMEKILEERKASNIQTILKSLKPTIL
jgi:TetR/AcrR family transcriptional regulator